MDAIKSLTPREAFFLFEEIQEEKRREIALQLDLHGGNGQKWLQSTPSRKTIKAMNRRDPEIDALVRRDLERLTNGPK